MKSRDNSGSLEAPVFTATIASGATQSGAVNIDGFTLVGIYIPSTFDGTTLTVQVAPTSDGTFVNAQAASSASTVYTITVAASQYVPIENLAISAGWQYIKFTAGTSQSTTSTILTLAVRPV